MNKIRPSLTTKVLLLVALPLVFQLGSVFWLLNLQNQAEEERKRALKAHDISNRINIITKDLYAIYQLIDNVPEDVLKPMQFYKDDFAPILTRLQREYFELDQVAGDDPDMRRIVERSQQSMGEAQLIIESVLAEFRTHHITNILKHYQATREQLRDLFHRTMNSDFMLISEHERKFLESSDMREATLRQQQLNSIIAACVIGILSSILIAIYVVKNITARLAVLNDNAKRLAKHEQLHARIDGHDEISELDNSFHQMADDLDEAAGAKQELVNMITHDLRSPLTAIRGTLELFKTARATTTDQRGQNLIELADRNTFRMMGLIDDLLDIEKINSGMMTINMSEICMAEAFENVKLSVDAWIKEAGIDVKITDTDLFVKGDGGKIERVLLNLVSNSIKFSPAGGVIWLSAEDGDDGKVTVTVSDQGKGIPADQLATVFERFKQAHGHEVKGGSGLGLTICKSIVELHGGRIWVSSAVGQGTAFHFTLPKA